MHQHLLADMNLSPIDETFQSPGAQRQCRSLAHGEILRLVCQQIRICQYEFSKSTMETADATHHPEDFITSFETCYPVPNLFDVPAISSPSTAGSGCFACSAAPLRIFVSRGFTPHALPQLALIEVRVESNDPAIVSCWADYQSWCNLVSSLHIH
jgi:hypothetical protein